MEAVIVDDHTAVLVPLTMAELNKLTKLLSTEEEVESLKKKVKRASIDCRRAVEKHCLWEKV